MVGLKIVGIIGALFLLGACVPQTKQTACQSNEAFNASLRTCVPVVNGPSSFININSFVPAFTVTAYKNSGVPITLSITISNPYAQTYTVEWERVFNGLPVSVTPTTPTSFTFIPSTLSTQVGTHIITAKVKDAFGVITDTHNFDVKINDLPLPIIDSASVAPITYNVTLNPTSAAQIFSFNIKNNGATIPAGFYNTTWSVTKNGAAVAPPSLGLPDVDNFTVFTTTGTNAAAFTFNPAAVGGGLGSYIIRGRLTNTSGDI